MILKITGLDKLQKELNDLANAARALDGEIGNFTFNPNDPTSVENAVVQMEQAIDAKVGAYRGSDAVENLINQMKERYREEIYNRAAKARAEGEKP